MKVATDLRGKQAKIGFTAGSGGTDITPSEGVVIDHRVLEHNTDFTEWANDCDGNEPIGYGWMLTVRCKVNKATTSSGNPQRPQGVAGTVTVYKNAADSANGKWVGACHVNQMTFNAASGGEGVGSPQMALYILIGTGPLVETK